MPETHGCGGDAAAYALGALDSSEADEFRRHLESCAVCRDEVAAFRHVVDALPMAAPQHSPPRGLSRRVMRDVRADQGQPARTAARLRQSLVPRRLAPRPLLAGALLAAVALAIVGGIELSLGGSSPIRVIQASVTAPAGSAQLRVAGTRAELIINHLPPPPAGRIYELWIKRGRRAPAPTSALFSVTASGAADVGVPGDVRGVSEIMVTPEPAGGSLVPTHAPVIVARLT